MFNWIIAHWDDILMVFTSCVTVASIIVKLTPTKRDDEALSVIMRLLNTVAINPKK